MKKLGIAMLNLRSSLLAAGKTEAEIDDIVIDLGVEIQDPIKTYRSGNSEPIIEAIGETTLISTAQKTQFLADLA